MKTFALVLIILGIVAVVCFAVAFFIELAKTSENKEEVVEIENNSTEPQEVTVEEKEEQNEEDFDLDAMLAKLEASVVENAKQEEVSNEEIQEEDNVEQNVEDVQVAETVDENKENEETLNNGEEETVEETNEVVEEVSEEEHAEDATNEETNVEESSETFEDNATSDELSEETQQVIVDDEPTDTEVDVSDAETNKGKVIVVREHTVEVINNGGAEKTEEAQPTQEVVDLSTRLASVRESLEKVDADLVKANRDVNKYERTERRKARNQKLLDKKAEDLTKLNLVLYSVTDIKNIDTEKKQKQAELVTHINELKSSIKDAQNYLETNKEKYENAQKMKSFFEGEKSRLEADEKEILTLMGQNTDNE